MTDPLSSANIDVRYECLDVFPIKWPNAGIEEHDSDGILLEIWRTGGTIQTNLPIPEGSWVELAPTGHTIEAQVICCEQDDYGFIVSVSVNQNQYDHWFPQSYCPPYLQRGDQEIEQFDPAANTLWEMFSSFPQKEHRASPVSITELRGDTRRTEAGDGCALRSRRCFFVLPPHYPVQSLGATPTRASGGLTKLR
jgi:hypothetical protein